MSVEDLRAKFQADAERFAKLEADEETVHEAAAYWLLYWVYYEVLEDQDGSRSDKAQAKVRLASAHQAAVRLLMRAAEQVDLDPPLDPALLWEEGRVCRELYQTPNLYDVGYDDAPYDIWPDCLGPARYQLPQAMQDAIRLGEGIFSRLMLRLEVSAGDLAEIASAAKKKVTRPPTPAEKKLAREFKNGMTTDEACERYGWTADAARQRKTRLRKKGLDVGGERES